MIEGHLDTRRLERALDDIGRRADQGFFRELAPRARQDQREHAMQQEGPDGQWAPRDPDTHAWRQGRRRRRRKLMGRLPGAISVKVHPDAVTITSKVAWSGIHQDGGTVGHGAQLPARPFLWWSEKFLGDAEEAALSYVLQGW